jgi:hypothetical protein
MGMSQSFHRQSAELREVLNAIEKEDPSLSKAWSKNEAKDEERDREVIGNSQVYASKLEAGIRNGAVAIGMTARTHSEAVDLVREALRGTEEPISPNQDRATAAVQREESLGLALADLYQNTQARGDGLNPENKEKIARRMKYTADVLAQAYNSPTCSRAVREKIDAITKKERVEAEFFEDPRSYLAEAIDKSSKAAGVDKGELPSVSTAISRLRNAGPKVPETDRGMAAEGVGSSSLKIGKAGLKMAGVQARANALANESAKMATHDR